MKIRSLALVISILFVTFAVNTALMAQDMKSKVHDGKVKTTVNKIETNTKDVKQNAGTTTHQKTNKIKGGENTVKNEVKTNRGKETTKINNKVKLNEIITKKIEKKSDEKIKN